MVDVNYQYSAVLQVL